MKASERLNDVLLHKGWKANDLASVLVGRDGKPKSLDSINLWLNKDTFSPTILRQLAALKKHGINAPAYFTDEKAPLELPDEEEDVNFKREILEIIKQFKEQTAEQMSRMNDNYKELISVLDEKNNALQSEVDRLKAENESLKAGR